MDESNDLIESKWSHTDVSDLTGKKFYVCTSTIQEPFITSRYSLRGRSQTTFTKVGW